MPRNQSEAAGSLAIKLAEVHVHHPAAGRPATYVRLANIGPEPVELSGWSLDLDGVALRFPPGSLLQPGQGCAVAGEPEAYARQQGQLPEYGYGAEHPSVRPMERPAGEPELTPWAGRVLLRDPDGRLVDALYWGNLQPGPGWKGAPVPGPPPGEVMHRLREEEPAAPGAEPDYVADTDTAADWEPGAAWMGNRVLRPGQTTTSLPTFRTRSPVVAFVAPDSGYAALAPVLDGARHTLDICLYQFTSPVLAEKVIAACRRGVAVRLLLDGSPYGGVLDKTRHVARQVAAAGGRVRWLAENQRWQVPKRYRYIHAKYVVADSSRSVVLSENFSRHSLPVHPQGGNRGWGVVVHSRGLARHLRALFAADWDPAKADSHPFISGDPDFGGPGPEFHPELADVRGEYEPRFGPERIRGMAHLTPILAPDHALYRQRGLLGLLAGARESIRVQSQYIPLHWGPFDHGSRDIYPNLYLEALVAAARRGVQVQVMIGGRGLDPDHPTDSTHTRDYLEFLARRERLDVAVRIAGPELGLTVHNKGVLVDDRYSLISSINWSENSPVHNRELALLVESPGVAAYFGSVFSADWRALDR